MEKEAATNNRIENLRIEKLVEILVKHKLISTEEAEEIIAL